jgi:phage recombination protein Bet
MSITVNKSSGEIDPIDSKKELLKRTIFKGATDDELELFSMVCKRTGLDPFMKQIHPVPRWDTKLGKNVVTMQTSIDGFRLIAERTGNYCPGRESTFVYDENNRMVSATAYVKKMTKDGTWHEIAATAYYQEYVQKNKDGKPLKFWEQMPHVMLAKCAESLALRKCFPAELSGIYTNDEMSQASNGQSNQEIEQPLESLQIIEPPTPLSEEQIAQIDYLFLELNDKDIEKKVYKWCSERFKVEDIYDIDAKYFPVLAKRLDSTIKAREASNGSQGVA